MKRLYKIAVTLFGTLMFLFVLGFGPKLFPAYDPDPKIKISQSAQAVANTKAKVVAARSENTAPPKKTWRNYVSAFFMLEPTEMVSKPVPDRTELQQLQRRSAGYPSAGQMAVIRTGQ